MKNDLDFIRDKIENSGVRAPEDMNEQYVAKMTENEDRSLRYGGGTGSGDRADDYSARCRRERCAQYHLPEWTGTQAVQQL